MGINFQRWKQRFLHFLAIMLAFNWAIAQQGSTVSGKITSADDGQPLPGVNIMVKGTSTGTTSDTNGAYSIVVSGPNDVLIFSYIGYSSEEVTIAGRSSINVNMAPDIKQLSEIVVVGYGTQKKEDLTGSVVSINAEMIEKQGPKVNPIQALQGVVPGLNISQTSNSADQGSFNITIRGRNSITANNTPLIVVDGVPYSGGFNEINQNDIQSVEVLKDASAAAIYGARGSNGVILITTKKGASGKPTIAYDGNVGVQEIYGLPPILSAEEYWQFALDRVGPDFPNQFPTLKENYDNGNFINWLDETTRTGVQQMHSVRLSGGSDRIKYFISGTLTDVKGIAVGDNFKQALGRVNLSLNVTDWLEVGTNTQYTFQDRSGLSAEFSGLYTAYAANPLMNLRDENGDYAIFPFPEQPTYGNPLSNVNAQDEDYGRRLFSNNYLLINVPFIPGLSYRLNTGYTISDDKIGRFWGNNTRVGFVNGGEALVRNIEEKDILLENIVNYQQQWGKHNIGFTGLYSTQKLDRTNHQIISRRFPSEALTWYQPDVAEVILPTSGYFEQKYVSQMARLNYGFDSRYLLTFTVRRDGYSGFGKDNKYGIFPSVALGWNIKNEPFFPETEKINLLKLRASIGRNGNQSINPYRTLARMTQMNFLGGPNGDQTAAGFLPASLATPNLGWETTNSVNLGVDFEILSSRLAGSIDLYQSNTYDLLLDRSISPVHGISSITQNIGETRNKGIEFALNSENIKGDNFSWSTQFNFSHNKNEIIDLYGSGEDDVVNNWFIGRSIDTNFDLVFDGIWQTSEDNTLMPTAKPGDIKVKDVNGDGTISIDDRDFIGQTNPKYIAGLTNTLAYKNFTLSFFVFTQQGITRLNSLWDTNLVTVDARENTLRFNWWSENNPSNEYPANRGTTNPFNVRFYQNASFVRLRDVTLSYSLPSQVTKLIGMNQVRFYGNIKNALTFTKWEGLDPELSGQRDVPMDRTFILGLNISL